MLYAGVRTRVLLALTVLCWGTTAAAHSIGPCGAPAQPSHPDALDRLIIQTMAAHHVPGLSVAVVKDGKVETARGYGLADLTSCTAASEQTLFGIGSISKQFTAVGVLTLVRDRRVSLDDPITKYLPEGKGVWDGITVRHLLTHTSGIPDYAGDDAKYPSIELDRASSPATAELVRRIAKAPLNFRPGADWAYSNTGYLLLSVLVERASGQPFPAFMREHVFLPLGMRATRFYSPDQPIAGGARGYEITGDGTVKPGRHVSGQFSHWGDMSMLSTAVEMGRWAQALGRDKLLPDALWTLMLTPVRLSDGALYPYGFGIRIDQVGTQPTWSHGGTFEAGYSAMFVVFPRDGLAIAMQSNYWGPASPVPDAAIRAVGLFAPALQSATARAPARDPQPLLTTALLKALEGADPKAGGAATTVAARRHSSTLAFARRALAHAGPEVHLTYVSCEAVRAPAPDAFGTPVDRVCGYRLDGGPEPVGLQFWLTSRNEIAGVTPW